VPGAREGRERNAPRARAAILAAAEEMFALDGFSGARIDRIAEASGYNKSLLFQYFVDKAGLYRAVLDASQRQIEVELDRIITPALDIRNVPLDAIRVRRVLEDGVRWSFGLYLFRPNLVRILAWEAAGGWPTLATLQATGAPLFVALVHHVVRFVRLAQAGGIVYPDLDPPVLVANLLGLALSYLSSLPRFTVLFPGDDFTSQAALNHAREQLVRFVVHATIIPSQEVTLAPGI